jgi:hypothetical protein
MLAGSIPWLFGVSVGASALGGMLGMASGIFIVPILTMFGGREHPHSDRREHRVGDRMLMWKRRTLPKGAADKCPARNCA